MKKELRINEHSSGIYITYDENEKGEQKSRIPTKAEISEYLNPAVKSKVELHGKLANAKISPKCKPLVDAMIDGRLIKELKYKDIFSKKVQTLRNFRCLAFICNTGGYKENGWAAVITSGVSSIHERWVESFLI